MQGGAATSRGSAFGFWGARGGTDGHRAEHGRLGLHRFSTTTRQNIKYVRLSSLTLSRSQSGSGTMYPWSA